MFRFTQEPSSVRYNQWLVKITSLVQQCVSVQTLSVRLTHTRSEYAAITLTSAPTRTVEQDL